MRISRGAFNGLARQLANAPFSDDGQRLIAAQACAKALNVDLDRLIDRVTLRIDIDPKRVE